MLFHLSEYLVSFYYGIVLFLMLFKSLIMASEL